MSRFRELLPYIRRQWPWLVAILHMSLLSSAVSALQPWPMKLLVDYALRDAGPSGSVSIAPVAAGVTASPTALVLLAAVASLAVFVLTSALSVGLSISWSMAGQRMAYGLAGDLFAR